MRETGTLQRGCRAAAVAALGQLAPTHTSGPGRHGSNSHVFLLPPLALQRKHDLVAAKKVEEAYPRWGLWGTDPGHKAGIAVGQRFSGRGPLKALGIHTTYFTGIQTGG